MPELKAFRTDGKHRIPALTEVLDLLNRKCFVNIELKSYETAEKVVELVEKYIEEKGWSYNIFWFPVSIGMPCSRWRFEFENPDWSLYGNRFGFGRGFCQIHTGKIAASALSFTNKRKHFTNTEKRIRSLSLNRQ